MEKKGRKEIVLKSQFRDRLLPLTVKETDGVKGGNLINININIPETERKFYQCSLFVNDSFFARKNCDSIISIFVLKPILNVSLKLNADERKPTRFLDSLITEKHFFKSINLKKIEINVHYNDLLFNYIVFNDETLKISRHGVKVYSPQKKAWVFLPKK